MLPWLTVIIIKVVQPVNFLAAGRLVAVGTGFLSLLGTYKLAHFLFKSEKIALLSSLFYVLSPFALFYDRMALYDSLFSAGVVWSVYFTLKTAKTNKTTDAVFWGVALGLTHLTKATAIFFSVLTPLIYFVYGSKFKTRAVLVSFIVSQIAANFFFLSSGFFEYQTKALDHGPSISQLINKPLDLFFYNMVQTFSWLISYLTLPFLIISFAGLVFIFFKKFRTFLVFGLVLLPPIFAMCYFGREYFPRYLTFVIPFLAVSVSFFLLTIFKKRPGLAIATIFLISLPMLKFDYAILGGPEKAPLPEIDKWQYVSGFPSGYGLKGSVLFLQKRVKSGERMTIVTEGSYSHYPNAYHLYFWKYPNVTILERWPLDKIDQELAELGKETDLYLIFRDDDKNGQRETYKKLRVKLVRKFTKPGDKDSVYVTKLIRNGI